MRRRALLSSVSGIAVASLILVGCSSGGTATPASTAASTSAATSSASSSATSSESSEETTSSASSAATGTVEVDAQTAAWFETFCGGLAPFGELVNGDVDVTSPEQAGQILTSLGQQLAQTSSDLTELPPPTFEGGEQLASEVQSALQQAGEVFVEFGERAATIDITDAQAGAQFGQDLQAALSGLEISQFNPSAEAREVAQAVPACQEAGLGG
jgi:hypothetical protein